MKIHHCNIVNAILQMVVGIYGIKEGQPSVFLTIVPLLLGLVVLPTQQSLQHEVKTAIRAVAIISFVSIIFYSFSCLKFLRSENETSLHTAGFLVLTNSFTFIFALFTLKKKKRSSKSSI